MKYQSLVIEFWVDCHFRQERERLMLEREREALRREREELERQRQARPPQNHEILRLSDYDYDIYDYWTLPISWGM